MNGAANTADNTALSPIAGAAVNAGADGFILHVDAAWVVVNKPAGLPSVPGRPVHLHDCAASRVQALWPDALTVHRLDMATSGLLVFARGAQNQRRLSQAFAAREVHKVYIAVVAAQAEKPAMALAADSAPATATAAAPYPSPEQHDAGLIDLPLAPDWPRRPLQQVCHVNGKPAQTAWRVLQHEGAQCRLELRPHTGRTHQLRVHLAAIDHPILGDALYAPTDLQARAPRLLLHASQLVLAHPVTGERQQFDCPAPF